MASGIFVAKMENHVALLKCVSLYKPPKKKKGNPVIDGVDTSTMSREQLEKFAHNLRNEMEREREERNFFQIERDKLRTFWEITRNQLEDAHVLIRAKEREVAVAQENAEVEIKNNLQQMKHLQYENHTRLGEIRAETMTQLKLSQEDHFAQELELYNDKRALKRLLREKEETTELEKQELKMKISKLLSQERVRSAIEADSMAQLHEKKLEGYIEEAETKYRMEIFEVEERKSAHIANLIESHKKAFEDMRNYYNDITLNNLVLISSLKEQMEQLRQHSEQNENLMFQLKAKNKQLAEPLKAAETELVELRKKLENFDRDRAALSRTKTRYSSASKQLNDLKWETEALRMRCDKLTEERDELKEKFEEAVMELQQNITLKNVLLERKLSIAEKEAEKREIVLGEVLSAAGMEPHDLSVKMEKLLKSKNDKIQNLRYELAKVCKAHDDMLTTFESKLTQHGIPKEELGFQPLKAYAILRMGSSSTSIV